MVLFLAPGSVVNASAAERLDLQARETGGLARGGYPAHALLKLPRSVPPTTKFHLLHGGKPVAAQFRSDGAGATARWWPGFQTDIAPYETRTYAVEFDDGVPAGPERGRSGEPY
jgi:hypothetical protein